MLIAETEYRYPGGRDHQALPRYPAGLFLCHHRHAPGCVGADRQFTLVLVFALFLVLGKALLMFAIARLFQYKSGESLRSAVALAQGGEFGFVLLALAGNPGFDRPQVEQSAIAAVLFSMLASPFFDSRSDWLVRKLIRRLDDAGGGFTHILVSAYCAASMC